MSCAVIFSWHVFRESLVDFMLITHWKHVKSILKSNSILISNQILTFT
jgi:hypothetical protein